MSGQMADLIVIDDVEWAIAEPLPGSMFEPRDHGVYPVMLHTANTRGSLARFRVDDGRLLLSDLQIGADDAPPAIAGVEPTTDEQGTVWTYLDLDLEIDWTGDILAGAEPLPDMYVHAGIPSVHHYARVIALDVEAGAVIGTEDRSAAVEEFRNSDDHEDGAFERMLKAIRMRLPGADDA